MSGCPILGTTIAANPDYGNAEYDRRKFSAPDEFISGGQFQFAVPR
jgi:hypothetical protein